MLCRGLSTMPGPKDADAIRREVPGDAMGVLPGDGGAWVGDPSDRDAYHVREVSGGVHCRADGEEVCPARGDDCCCRLMAASYGPAADAVERMDDGCFVVRLRGPGVCRVCCVRCRDACLGCCGCCLMEVLHPGGYYCDCRCRRGARRVPLGARSCYCCLRGGNCRTATCRWVPKAFCLLFRLTWRVMIAMCGFHHRVPSGTALPYTEGRLRAWRIMCRLRCCGIAVS